MTARAVTVQVVTADAAWAANPAPVRVSTATVSAATARCRFGSLAGPATAARRDGPAAAVPAVAAGGQRSGEEGKSVHRGAACPAGSGRARGQHSRPRRLRAQKPRPAPASSRPRRVFRPTRSRTTCGASGSGGAFRPVSGPPSRPGPWRQSGNTRVRSRRCRLPVMQAQPVITRSLHGQHPPGCGRCQSPSAVIICRGRTPRHDRTARTPGG